MPKKLADDARFFFGFGVPFTLMAYSQSASNGTMIVEQKSRAFSLPPGFSPIGVVEGGRPKTPAIIGVDETRTRIVAFGEGSIQLLVTTVEPISQATMSTLNHVVAFITQSGGVGVFCCRTNVMLLHADPGVSQ